MKKIILLLLLTLLLCSCSEFAKPREENTGVYVDREGIEDVSEQLSEKEIILMDGIDEDMYIFYWTENGSVFHSSLNCSSLKSSKKIICGNINHAYAYGIDKTCSRCFG